MIGMFLEYSSYIFAAIALIGAYLNSNLDPKGFYLWMITNTFFVIFHLYFSHYGVATLYGCYLATNINGIRKTKR